MLAGEWIELLDDNEMKLGNIREMIKETYFLDSRVETNFSAFTNGADIILANRLVSDLENVSEKVFTRDLFHEN